MRITAMIGTGLIATPTAKARTSPIPSPIVGPPFSWVGGDPGRRPPTDLLPREVDAQLGRVVLDQLAADVDGDMIDGAGERERRGVVGRDGRAGVGAAGQRAGVEHEGRRDRYLG